MASGALAARVAEVQVLLISISMVSLVAAHGFAYRQGDRGRRPRLLLWIATPVSIALWALPHVIRLNRG